VAVTDQPSFGRASLIAPEAETNGYEGAGILEAVMGIKDGLRQGDFYSAGANTLVTGLSTLGAVMDPFQAIFAAGVGWLMEHVAILREPLDWLAGDPKEIEGHAVTWRNIQGRMHQATEFFVDEVASATSRWDSSATTAYRERAGRHAEEVRALGGIGDVLAEITIIAGAMVGVVRNTVRDVIAELVGAAVSKALQALAVVTIPKVIAEVAMMVTECSTKITNLLTGLVRTIGRVADRIPIVAAYLEKIAKSLSEAGANATVLGAYRIEAAGTATSPSSGVLGSYGSAHGTISTGHLAAHGSSAEVAGETLPSAIKANSVQNAGASVDKTRDGEQDPPPIMLPL
jgi:hypothetical protein